jgi:prolipoprotein diacylglyceryl transferase
VSVASVTQLALIPSPTQGVWHLGPVPIRAYAIFMVLGIIAAAAVTEVRMRRRGAPPWAVLDIVTWAVPFGIVGARIYHVITSPAAYFGEDGNPLDALRIWQGGLGIWGAVAGGAVGAWIGARRLGIPLTFVADALAPGLPLAQAIGRLGNWFNNELYGRPTSLPWGLKVYQWDAEEGRALTDGSGQPISFPGLYHPTFLYELLWNLGVVALVFVLDRKFRFGKGRAFALYVMAYCVGRFWVEALRIDEAQHILGMRLNDWTAILVFAGALAYFVRTRGAQPERLVVDEDGTIRVEAGDGDARSDNAVDGDEADEADVADGDGDAADGDGDAGSDNAVDLPKEPDPARPGPEPGRADESQPAAP